MNTNTQAEAGEAELAHYRALLVEDHPALAEATAEFMRLHGFHVQVASSGREALKLAEEFHPVLVLCDVSLPDMTGLDVARALRAMCGANDLLVAMLTALSANDLRALQGHAKGGGADLYLSKPLTSETIADLLSRLEVLGCPVRPDAACSSPPPHESPLRS